MCRRWPLDEWEAEQAEAEEAARPEGELAGAIVEGLIMERAEEEGAAAKVQAIHRGNQSRKERAEEGSAAAKVYSDVACTSGRDLTSCRVRLKPRGSIAGRAEEGTKISKGWRRPIEKATATDVRWFRCNVLGSLQPFSGSYSIMWWV